MKKKREKEGAKRLKQGVSETTQFGESAPCVRNKLDYKKAPNAQGAHYDLRLHIPQMNTDSYDLEGAGMCKITDTQWD